MQCSVCPCVVHFSNADGSHKWLYCAPLREPRRKGDTCPDVVMRTAWRIKQLKDKEDSDATND